MKSPIDDVQRLKSHGFDDRAVHDAVQVVSYFNYITRIADGLGVEQEAFIQNGSRSYMNTVRSDENKKNLILNAGRRQSLKPAGSPRYKAFSDSLYKVSMLKLPKQTVLIAILVLMFLPTLAFSAVKDDLRERCLAAIESSGAGAKRSELKATVMDLPGGKYMFEFKDAAGGSFFCDICEDNNPKVQCGNIGLRLMHRPKDGEATIFQRNWTKNARIFCKRNYPKTKAEWRQS